MEGPERNPPLSKKVVTEMGLLHLYKPPNLSQLFLCLPWVHEALSSSPLWLGCETLRPSAMAVQGGFLLCFCLEFYLVIETKLSLATRTYNLIKGLALAHFLVLTLEAGPSLPAQGYTAVRLLPFSSLFTFTFCVLVF